MIKIPLAVPMITISSLENMESTVVMPSNLSDLWLLRLLYYFLADAERELVLDTLDLNDPRYLVVKTWKNAIEHAYRSKVLHCSNESDFYEWVDLCVAIKIDFLNHGNSPFLMLSFGYDKTNY